MTKKIRKKMEMTEILCRNARRPICVATASIFEFAIYGYCVMVLRSKKILEIVSFHHEDDVMMPSREKGLMVDRRPDIINGRPPGLTA